MNAVTPRRYARLVHPGNVLVDVVLTVPHLPERGGDVVATSTTSATGGGFNVLAAASRLGLPSAYAGAHGTGPRADAARADLAREGVAVLTEAHPGLDTGFTVALVDGGGERTFVTSPGAEARLRTEQLTGLEVGPSDVVLVSGYGLVHDDNRTALLTWLATLDDAVTVVVDPGPLVVDIPAPALEAVLSRSDWITANARETSWLGGVADPSDAAGSVARRWPRAALVVRLGADGAILATDGRQLVVPARPVEAVDSTGAGDAHTGALLAELAAGRSAVDAVAFANRAAAHAVTVRGPATGPTRAQLA
jgi:sugar/nucleoside kinase (ribokinase family)